VGLHESRGEALRRTEMEYTIAGITAILLFIYLMYALLRPEKF
jgi:K+-transporting ATPase KdpF subunit